MGDHWSISPRRSLLISRSRIDESLSQIYRRVTVSGQEETSEKRGRRQVRFDAERKAGCAFSRGKMTRWGGSTDRQGRYTGDIKLNPDTESVTVERRIRKRSLGIDKIVSPAVIRFTTSNKSRSRRGRSPGLILVDLAPALVPRYCRSVPFNEETSTGWTRPRFTFQHVPPLILFDPAHPLPPLNQTFLVSPLLASSRSLFQRRV